MGCGSSKLDHLGDVIMVPAKIRPILFRKLENIKARARRVGSSRKELLKDTSYHTLSIASNSSNNYYVLDSQRGSSLFTKQQDDTCDEFKDAVESLPGTPTPGTPKAETADHQLEDEELIISKVAAEFLSWNEMRAQSKWPQKDEDEDEDEADEEDDEDLRERYISPGSPSFRVYYIESLASTIKDARSSFDESELEEDYEDEKESKTDRVASASVEKMQPAEAVKQKQGIITRMKKQGGKLKKVIVSKPRPIAVAKLLKVPCSRSGKHN
ncbi:hypothetical protein LINGRAHAP2_LOCUS29379, partial [Linum grandiflorum]